MTPFGFFWDLAERLRPRVACAAFRLFSQLRVIVPYQPVPWLGIRDADRSEACDARWEVIQQELAYLDAPGSAMDLGSQLGYFSFKLAGSGWLCLAVEASRSSFETAKLIQTAAEIPNVAFRRMNIDKSSIRQLPTVDVVVFLSLWHHLCRAEGFGAAREILAETFLRTRRVLFFETGQSDESYMNWSKHMPRMEPDARSWIERMLYDAGAAEVRHLGAFSTHLGPVRRHLFAAYTQRLGELQDGCRSAANAQPPMRTHS